MNDKKMVTAKQAYLIQLNNKAEKQRLAIMSAESELDIMKNTLKVIESQIKEAEKEVK